MTCHVLHAGDGYIYLTRQVASGDVARSGRDPLVEYYQAAGNPPGEWVGSGCADLGVSGVVTEEQMAALFGEGLRPDANDFITARLAAGASYEDAVAAARLGRKFYQFDKSVPLVTDIQSAYAEFETTHRRRATVAERRRIKERLARAEMRRARPDGPAPDPAAVRVYLTDQLGRARLPVAGFDLVFSPVKSVSVLWALAGHEVRAVVERVHDQAWRAALAYGEREAAFTRVGANGVAFVTTSGFVATAFQHRDSRAGDPDLHTHVAISNRVLADDGRWRTIDSRQLHKVAVSMSERYNSLVEQGLAEALGVRFRERHVVPGKRPVRELVGIPNAWIRGFSQRRAQVETHYAELVRDYVARYGQTPPRSVQHRLAQEAALRERPEKEELRTLAEQVAEWTGRAQEMLPSVEIRRIADVVVGFDQRAAARGMTSTAPQDLAEVAAAVVDRVSKDRSTWTVYHVRAEADRQLRRARFATAAHRVQAVEDVTRIALDRCSVLLAVDLEADMTGRAEGGVPRLLRRRDGESVFRRRGSNRHSSAEVLAAEQRLLQAARQRRGAAIADGKRDAAMRRWEEETGLKLNAGQRALVEHFVSSGRALAVAIGPPGSGKSRVMAAVRAIWQSTGGRVVGLAPSAAAAGVLGGELGVRADTLHRLTTKHHFGHDTGIRAGDMILVDEAGMAGTRLLDEIRALAAQRGAVVRLVGDYRQLAAVEAGGALRLLHHDAGGVELTEVRRFVRPEEAEAVLRVRVGDEAAIPFYVDNHRLVGGVGPVVIDQLYRDWTGDVAASRVSIMISDSTETARELSVRAQTERRAAGLVDAKGVALHDGTVAGVGDRIVTRQNQRTQTTLSGRDYVKNGDLWQVLHRFDDGRLTVQHLTNGGLITLPARYVATHVELGYAATIHRSQGLTVDIARAFLSPSAVREAALVALSRGRHANHAYLDTTPLLHPDEPATLPGDLYYRYREHAPAAAALAAILRREGAELSATEHLRDALDEPHRLSTVVPEYLHGLHVYRGPTADDEAEQWVWAALPGHAADIVGDEAWPELVRVLHDAHAAGADPVVLLRDRAADRPLTDDPQSPAESVAQVMHYRIVTDLPIPAPDPFRPELLPGWVPTPPGPGDSTYVDDGRDPRDIAELDAWLRARARQIAHRVQHLGQRVADEQPVWSTQLGPMPDEPLGREAWIRCAGQVAAVRERWRIPDTITDLLPRDARGEQARAISWVLAYLRVHPPEHAAAHAAQQRADWHAHAARVANQQRQRREQQRAEQLRRAAFAELLRNVWRHEPDLVDRIIDSPAFAVLARRLHDAEEGGFDLYEVLEQIPIHHAAATHITNPTAYTAALIDIAVDRIRTGQADRDAHHRADRARLDQLRDQAADLVREHWASHPDLADTMITAPAFSALARALDRYLDAGLDPRDLLTRLPLTKIDTIAVDKPAFAVYTLHQVANRQLDALRDVEQAATDAADRQRRERGAAATLRTAWAQHLDLADRVIAGPAFRYLAERMEHAHQTGHDLHTILKGLDPVTLTAPTVPNPSGAVTFAFTRALNNTPPTPPSATRPEPAARERQPAIPHWTARTHGHLATHQIADQIAAAERHAANLDHQRTTAAHTLEQQRADVAAGRGDHVTAVDAELDRLRAQLHAARQAHHLETQWHTATERLAEAAEHGARIETQLADLGRFTTHQRQDLTRQLEHHRAVEEQLRHKAADLAARAATHQQQAGTTDGPHLASRLTAAESNHPAVREQARQRDQRTVHQAQLHVTELDHQHTENSSRLDQLRIEHALRQERPDHINTIEDQEREGQQTLVQPPEPAAPPPQELNNPEPPPQIEDVDIAALHPVQPPNLESAEPER